MAVDLVTTYPGRVDAADAEYPFGKPRNRVSPGDGTPWDEATYRDFVGLQAAAMRQAGITAVTNAPDKVGASQALQGLARHMAGGSTFYEDSGVADTYVLTVPGVAPNVFEAPSVLFDGMELEFLAANACTGGAVTVDPSGLGAKAAVREDGSNPPAAAIDAVSRTVLRYDLAADNFKVVRGAAPLQFESLQTSVGYQKLPSGLIIQWSGSAAIAPGGTGAFAFPIVFPNAFFRATLGQVTQNAEMYFVSGTTTTITLGNGTTSGVSGAAAYIAIGH